MSRAQPGAVILDQLRNRIVTGLYFGNWQPGERLPSIRDIADAEAVDRKTAAAAYHRLEEEGLVEVKARSGAFLRDERNGGAPRNGPLERLQRRWLKNTYDGARALGLDTRTVLRLFHAVAEVESTPVPVVEEDDATARTIADELRRCVGIEARPVRLHDSSARLPSFASAPFAITTPYHAATVREVLPRTPLISATLSLELLHSLMERAAAGPTLIAVPSEWIAARVEAALRQRLPEPARERVRVTVVEPGVDLAQLRREVDSMFVWPGCAGAEDVDASDMIQPVRLLSEATLDRVRGAVLEAALRYAATTTQAPTITTPTVSVPRAAIAAWAAEV